MEKVVHCEKAFLCSDPSVADDRFVSSAVIRTAEKIAVGLGFYNGRGNLIFGTDIPILPQEGHTANGPCKYNEIEAGRALEMLGVLQDIIHLTLGHLHAELKAVKNNEVPGSSRGS
jgi:hypothetical protein